MTRERSELGQRLQPGPLVVKMVGHFSNLLRSKGRDDDMETFKTSVMSASPGSPEACDILLSSIENSVNKRQFVRLKTSLDELSAMSGKLGSIQKKQEKNERLKKVLVAAASNLNLIYVKSKNTPEAAQIAPVLISLYGLMLQDSDSETARLKIEFNMAEVFIGLKKYEAAAFHYRWIADLNPPADKEGQNIQNLARFRSLSARYETLLEQKAFPKDLAAKSIKGAPETALSKPTQQWVSWIDQYEANPHQDAADLYQFEASRILYVSGHIEDAITRLRRLIKAYPQSTQVVAASSLILDTYIASEKWEEANLQATEFMKAAPPAQAAYRAKLLEVASDSYFKMTETLYQAMSYAEALVKADTFLTLYPTSKRRSSCLALAGNAALALKDKKRALTYFSAMMKAGGQV